MFGKSKRRRRAEQLVEQLLALKDEGLDAARTGKRRAKVRTRKTVRKARHEAAAARARAADEARAARRKAVKVGDNISDMVGAHPAATIGGALALAIAVGAGATFWLRRD